MLSEIIINQDIIFQTTNLPLIGIGLFILSMMFMSIGIINEKRKNSSQDN